jgi:hypothetical protein
VPILRARSSIWLETVSAKPKAPIEARSTGSGAARMLP